MKHTVKSPSLKMSSVAVAVATPLAVIAAGVLVWQGSTAAFTGQTRNTGNDWSTGSVALTDDDQGAARFQVANMAPGATDKKCIKVTANTTVPGTVKGYTINPVFPSAALADRILVSVRGGTGGSFADCAGFTASETVMTNASLTQVSQSNNYGASYGSWAVGSGASAKTYEITYKFDTTGMTQVEVDDLQGKRAALDFQWELQSN